MIAKLIQVWNERPQRVEPDDAAHLEYIFTKLLPVLRDAMPTIVNSYNNGAMPVVNDQIATPVREGSQSIPRTPAPGPEPSSHIPAESQSTAGNAEASGQAGGIADKPASSLGTVVVSRAPVPPPGQPLNKRAVALQRARAAKSKKRADALLAPPQ